MGQIVQDNVKRALKAVLDGDMKAVQEVYKVEETIDNMEKMLTEYLIKVENLSLTERQKKLVTNLFYSVSDIERVGDHAENIAEQVEYMENHGLEFSELGMDDLESISESVLKSFRYAIDARQTGNMDSRN